MLPHMRVHGGQRIVQQVHVRVSVHSPEPTAQHRSFISWGVYWVGIRYSAFLEHYLDCNTDCQVTLCRYFVILFLRSFLVRNVIWTYIWFSVVSYGQKLEIIWIIQNRHYKPTCSVTGHPTFSRHVTQYLHQQVPDRRIGRGGPQNCPLRSPDLTLSIFPCMVLHEKLVVNTE
jgi:hypothetical protein